MTYPVLTLEQYDKFDELLRKYAKEEDQENYFKTLEEMDLLERKVLKNRRKPPTTPKPNSRIETRND
jgi:hypothetical protein